MSTFTDPQPVHWEDYGRFQQVKHDLIRNYLGGWFPKLGFWSGRVVYLDTHAGRGSYAGDNPGSPLVALETLLQHSARDRLLKKSEFRFAFIERDECNVARLKKKVAAIGPVPPGVFVEVESQDAFVALRSLVNFAKSEGKQVAPAFVFVDPYGFKLPGDLLAELMKFESVELFVNVMWREMDMAISQMPEEGHGQAENLDRVFGSDAWRGISRGTMVERADRAAELLAARVGAKWWTHVRMVSGGDAVRFFLLHLTNHDDGRDLMKDCVWKVCPGGNMSVRRSDNPDQFFLVEPEPDLRELGEWVSQRLRGGPETRDTLHQELRSTVWLPRHLREVEAELIKQGEIERRGKHLSVASQARLF